MPQPSRVLLLLLLGGCVHAPPPPEPLPVAVARPEDAPRACLTAFLDAVEAVDWVTAWSLLSSPLRARYTPERLREDYAREPLAAERLRRARLVVAGPVQLSEAGAEFPLGEARGVRLTREEAGYRVAALE